MSEAVSALAGARAEGLFIGMEDLGVVGQVTLKADLSASEVANTFQAQAGLTVPAPLSVTTNESGSRAVWMAPDEVLFLMPGGAAAADRLIVDLGTALGSVHHLAANVTDARTVLRLSGASVPEVLAKGAPVDLSPAVFLPGTARRTHMAGIAVAFWRLNDAQWEIVCLRSYGHHLWSWLETASVPGSEVG